MFVSEILEQIAAAVSKISSMPNYASARIETLLAIMTQFFWDSELYLKKGFLGPSDVQVEASVTNWMWKTRSEFG